MNSKTNPVETTAQNAVENRWLTPEVTAVTDKLCKEKWFVREVIYPKEILGCEIFEYNGCMRLYHNKDRFFAMEGERLNTEAGKYCNLNVDFFSAERIDLQKPDNEAFDRWNNGENIELTSLWQGRQLVIAARHDDRQLLAFAPIFAAYTPEFHSTKDMERSLEFENEFLAYRKCVENSLDETQAAEALSFLQNSYNLLLWLKRHCY